MLGFRIPDADQAMLISGKKGGAGAAPFQVILGHRKWVPPFLYKVDFLSLKQYRDSFTEECFTAEKIPVRIVATIAFKIPADTDAILNAGQRFLSDQKTISEAVGQITTGAVRGIVGEMKLEQIISDRATLQQKVFEHAKQELQPHGLQVDALNIAEIQDLSDGGSAIAALSAPHLAQIRRDAAIAAATAEAESAQAQQAAAVKQADYERQTEVTKAGYAAEIAKANAESQAAAQVAQAQAQSAAQVAQALAAQQTEVAQAKARGEVGEANAERDRRQRVAQAKADAETGKAAAAAAQAGPLAQATAQHDVAVAQTALAQQQADQNKEEQRRDIVIPALAQAEARVAQAKAEAEATQLAAAAAASSDRVSLDKQIIEQLPQVAQAIADGLKGSKLTILNGPDGLTEMATGVISQAMSILDAARGMRTAVGNGNGHHGNGDAAASLGVGATEGAEANR